MRLVSFHTEDGPAAAVQLGEDLVPVSALDAPSSDREGPAGGTRRRRVARAGKNAPKQAGERIALADVTLHAPVTDPQKIICLGLNYRDHAEETGQDIPTAPMWFAKFANSLIGSGRK